MSRQKRLKPIDDYLKPPKKRYYTDEGVFPMLESWAAQGLVTIAKN